MLNRIIIILTIIAAAVGYSVYQKQSLHSQLSTKPEAILAKLPEGEFQTLDGGTMKPEELLKDNGLLVVHFWGTWCGPCEAELPDLLAFIKRFENRPEVKFLLVATNDELLKVKKHLKSLPIPKKASIHWVLDNKNVHRDNYGTTRVPETYVFSSDKSTLRKYVGPQEWNKTMFFQTFDEFLQISSSKL